MSEKRFNFVKSLDDDNCFIKDTVDNQIYLNEEIADLLNYLNERFKLFSDELYCKDRKLEELGVPIECCDKKMSEKRFKKGLNLSCVDTRTEKSYWHACNLCGLLNKIAEENERLKNEQDSLESSLQFFAKQCKKLQEENEMLKKDIECCEYKHFLTEQKKQREKVERGDLSDFTEWKYLQCKYYKRDYDKQRDICTRIASNSLLNSCLHNKCTKMVLKSVMEMKE